ncbi:GtrA family protein [Brucella sp. MAB-22]|uniref:GtrA family protein n=1 Tax=Brucella sp. MAB-22 TaxID=2986424 RepID=UPI0039B4AEF9
MGATIVHLVAASALIYINPKISIFNANALAFSIAVVVSFFGHSAYTFRTQGNLLKFSTVALIGLASNNIVAYTILWVSGIKLLSIAIGTLIAPVIVYLLSSLWVFTHKKTGS